MTTKKLTTYEILEEILKNLQQLNERMSEFSEAINALPEDVKNNLKENTNDSFLKGLFKKKSDAVHTETAEEGKEMGSTNSRGKGQKGNKG